MQQDSRHKNSRHKNIYCNFCNKNIGNNIKNKTKFHYLCVRCYTGIGGEDYAISDFEEIMFPKFYADIQKKTLPKKTPAKRRYNNIHKLQRISRQYIGYSKDAKEILKKYSYIYDLKKEDLDMLIVELTPHCKFPYNISDKQIRRAFRMQQRNYRVKRLKDEQQENKKQ